MIDIPSTDICTIVKGKWLDSEQVCHEETRTHKYCATQHTLREAAFCSLIQGAKGCGDAGSSPSDTTARRRDAQWASEGRLVSAAAISMISPTSANEEP